MNSPRLTITTAITGLISDATRLRETLPDLPTSKLPSHELQNCRSTAHVLLSALSTRSQERASWIGVDDVVASLADVVLALVELGAGGGLTLCVRGFIGSFFP
ncbi:hypothetical protein GQ602_006993 [Ophiocordyceps camponoti-floridani]|uniref:Uncharacterized protein n=1 Tax=Ophiocordyceps camponoti-floridani TaxID=2030778 RepID=A0A8H4Q0H3_9HYPO|nr:hypothetical protein GQ602_006993 [Ophiocordyceps camponoti-floridani]